jgi:hydroxymethylglutaryl-CoA lyase
MAKGEVMSTLTSRQVHLREVGPRDGLQAIKSRMTTADKIAWIRGEAAAGMPEIEICSFVPAKYLPMFADAAEVVAAAKAVPGLLATVLVPNVQGAVRALEAQAAKINLVVSVSEGHNLSNVRRSRAESMAAFREIALKVKAAGYRPKLALSLATSFGCTIDGVVAEDEILRMAAEGLATGIDELVLADSVGYANPTQVRRVMGRVLAEAGAKVTVSLHLHDTRGLALANALAGFEAGVRNFDASLGGIGGCPYAPGATGNVAMEDVVFMFESMGMATGVDLEALLRVREFVQAALPDETLVGSIARAGVPKGWHPATPRRRVAA